MVEECDGAPGEDKGRRRRDISTVGGQGRIGGINATKERGGWGRWCVRWEGSCSYHILT